MLQKKIGTGACIVNGERIGYNKRERIIFGKHRKSEGE